MNGWLGCVMNVKILCLMEKNPTLLLFSFLDVPEPIDNDVVMHILRLRGKLGWQTKLPSCEWLAREADVARLQKFTLTVNFTFPSPHTVQLHILEMMLVINLQYLFPEVFASEKG